MLREIRSEMNHDSNEPSSFLPPADARLAAGADGATLDGLADGFLSLDRHWRVRYLNPAAERLLRRSRLDLVGHGLWDSCPDLVGTGYYDACRGAMQTGRPAQHIGYYAPLASWFEARAFPHEGGLAVLFRDVSREREETAQLRYQATHDYLTGLPNRRQCMDTLSTAIAEAEQALAAQGPTLAVLFLDLDRFKEVNDAFGHAEGDLLLCDVAERLRKFLTPAIFCARVGGDEFLLVLRGTNERAAEALANSILNALSTPSDIHGRSVSLGASIGIALMNSPGESAEMLLNYADAAMYAAKSAGRFQV
ncbi:MAG: GGDEF domain-containing protein, partial [Achromobacter sp.]|nr:GGDEF domain-containing protein [Achromobacter sp.]